MNILELFSGSQSFTNVAKQRGDRTYTSDITDHPNTDYVIDIMDFDVTEVPFIPDIIWASPPCQTFSVASISKHWTGGKGAYIPNTVEAFKGLEIVKRTMHIILFYKMVNNHLLWLVENPRGLLRKVGDIPEKYLNTVTYCQYNDPDRRMKPTDIWTNCLHWKPRKMCKNGDNCHEAAPRGSRTGTQGLKSNYERSKVPIELCEEFITACILEKLWIDELYSDQGSVWR